VSQCSRVLEVLRDGKGHSIGEIHERAGTMRLNSRVADLRKMGFHVIYYRENGLHTYRLIDASAGGDSAPAATDGSLPLIGPPTTSAGGPSPDSSAEVGNEAGLGSPQTDEDPGQGQPQKQLEIWSAAA
jgi:hypothetical protein